MEDAPAPGVGEPLELLRDRLRELADIESVCGLLGWDQETMMPPAGVRARAEQMATLERLLHDLLTAEEVGGWLAALDGAGAAGDLDPARPADRDAALVRVARRDRDKALRVPRALRSELARARSLGQHAWAAARAAGDFAAFLPHLRGLVELTRRYVDCFDDLEHPYDALLDDYEPGRRTSEVRALFTQLRAGLEPLLEQIELARAEGRAPEPLAGPFPVAAQRTLLRGLLPEIGFDPNQSRLDESAHPFSTAVSREDQRITVRYGDESLESLFGGLHEFGHALYEAQIHPALEHTPLCSGVSSGMHESQSRLWENMVGRSRAGASFLLPRLRAAFPERFCGVDEQELYRSVNVVRPSPIRVQADEVTYGLHIILRFELEVELFEGTLAPEQLADAWRERMRSYLGIDIANDACGVLQDIHWAFGGFGYFPTYALGNLIAAQLWARVREDDPALDERIARGDFGPLREWLRERVHRYGRMLTPAQTLRRAVGAQLDAGPFLDYLWDKHAEVHGVVRR